MDERGEKDEEEHGVAEEETAAVVLKEVEVEVEMEMVGGSEEASAPLLLAHPCSLLQLLLRACAGCLVRLLHGHCSDGADDDPLKAAAADDDDAAPEAAAAAAAAAAADGGDKAATYLYMQEVWSVRRRPTTPSRPREGSGGNGGNHH